MSGLKERLFWSVPNDTVRNQVVFNLPAQHDSANFQTPNRPTIPRNLPPNKKENRTHQQQPNPGFCRKLFEDEMEDD